MSRLLESGSNIMSMTEANEKDIDIESPPTEATELPKPEQAPPEPPEGGIRAWMAVLGASIALFVSFGWVNCMALFQAEYERLLRGYTSSDVSWITSMSCKASPCIFIHLGNRSFGR